MPAWVKQRCPELVGHDEVLLGHISPGGRNRRLELAAFLARTVAYGLIRSDFKTAAGDAQDKTTEPLDG